MGLSEIGGTGTVYIATVPGTCPYKRAIVRTLTLACGPPLCNHPHCRAGCPPVVTM